MVQLGLEQSLADTCHVAVPEDAEAAFDEAVFDTVPLAALRGEEPDDGLPDGESLGAHAPLPGTS
jgi:hypothetical protein